METAQSPCRARRDHLSDTLVKQGPGGPISATVSCDSPTTTRTLSAPGKTAVTGPPAPPAHSPHPFRPPIPARSRQADARLVGIRSAHPFRIRRPSSDAGAGRPSSRAAATASHRLASHRLASEGEGVLFLSRRKISESPAVAPAYGAFAVHAPARRSKNGPGQEKWHDTFGSERAGRRMTPERKCAAPGIRTHRRQGNPIFKLPWVCIRSTFPEAPYEANARATKAGKPPCPSAAPFGAPSPARSAPRSRKPPSASRVDGFSADPGQRGPYEHGRSRVRTGRLQRGLPDTVMAALHLATGDISGTVFRVRLSSSTPSKPLRSRRVPGSGRDLGSIWLFVQGLKAAVERCPEPDLNRHGP